MPKTAAMNTPDPHAFATRWCARWNAHDLEGLLAHFTDDVVFTSPVASRILGGDGIVRGKAMVIDYRNQAGARVCEVLRFVGELVSEGHGTYLVEAASD
jgi:ketosteroid isomerase-like protein